MLLEIVGFFYLTERKALILYLQPQLLKIISCSSLFSLFTWQSGGISPGPFFG